MNKVNSLLSSYRWALTETKLKAMASYDADAMPVDTEDDDPGYDVVNGIAIISINGVLFKYADIWTQIFGGVSTQNILAQFKDALDNPQVSATLFVVDSPGGMVDGTTELAEAIANSSKPTCAYVSDMCCSGAYWLASQCDEIYSNSAATIGSIGVYTVLEDTSKMYQDAGIKVNLIKAGAYKGVGVDGVPITDAQLADQQTGIDDIYEMFCEAVSEGRGIKDVKAVATGQTWIAAKAEKLGLIDGISTLQDVASKLVEENEMEDQIKLNKADHEKLMASVSDAEKRIAEAKDAGYKAGVEAEGNRVKALIELAGDRPAFALEQIAKGANVTEANVALVAALKAELSETKKQAAQPKATGAAPLATTPTEARESKDEWDTLSPEEQKAIGSKETFAAYKLATTKFKVKIS